MPVTVATFYRFVDLPDCHELREPIFQMAERHGLLGTILLATEGINSTISGSREDLARFFLDLAEDARFEAMEVKYSGCEQHPFGRLRVRIKKEIVRMKAQRANPNDGVGEYVEPRAWNDLIKDPRTLTIDVRNDYEVAEGTFSGAINPKTGDFWEFPDWVEVNLTDKDQPLAMFCTGGIRCERATAYLVARGFRHVHHLKGGILNYLEKVPKEESLWQGDCFVFDDRRAVDHDLCPAREGSGTEA